MPTNPYRNMTINPYSSMSNFPNPYRPINTTYTYEHSRLVRLRESRLRAEENAMELRVAAVARAIVMSARARKLAKKTYLPARRAWH